MRLVPLPVPKRAPTSIQQAPFGSNNAASGNTVRPRLLPNITAQGTPLAKEHFDGSEAPPWAQRWAAALTRLQNKIAAAIQANKQAPDANGVMLPGVSFTAATPITIAHGLGTTWLGYRVQNVQVAGATFYATRGATDAHTITLTPSATCTADVWVYAQS